MAGSARSGCSAWGRAVAALALVTAACGSEPEPRWASLLDTRSEREFTLEPILETVGRRTLRLVHESAETRLELTLERDSWVRDPALGCFRAGVGFWLAPRASGDAPPRLVGERAFAWTQSALRRDADQPPPLPGTFFWRGPRIYLGLEPGAEPPGDLVLSCALAQLPEAGAARIQGARFSGRAVALRPGERRRWRIDGPPRGALRFGTAVEPWIERDGPAGDVRYRLRIDGQTVFEETASSAAAGHAWHTVALPEAGGECELVFEVEGALASVFLFDPILGPAEVGRPGRRPWPDERPDIVVFLADTFRADNLRTYGGALALTPNLDALAARSLCFLRAWSVGTYTLPAHASLFSGLYPRQAGIVGQTSVLPGQLETIAERLAREGYRTGAITDAGLVSRVFGMDQGFDFFDEERTTLAATLARALAFLAADDGRPAFLFVHTYRTHAPYTVSAETRAALGSALGLGAEDEHEGLTRELRALAARMGWDLKTEPAASLAPLPDGAAAADVIRRIRALYLGGVADLDREFGPFLRELEARGHLRRGALVFTSDHGEAFGEHGDLYHGKEVFESQTRIPLLIAGGGRAPARIEHAASLVDLAPTLAELAGIAPPEEWEGRSLLALREERAVFSFECESLRPDATLSVVEGAHKVIGFEDPRAIHTGQMLGAFDLARDPGEQTDLQGVDAFGSELLRRHAHTLERLLAPTQPRRESVLDAAKLEELRELGYAGGLEGEEH